MIIELTAELEEKVQTLMHSGNYTGETELFREALELPGKREQLRKDLADAAAQVERGETIEAEMVFDELERRLE